MTTKIIESDVLERGLRNAIILDQLSNYYQPQICSRTGKVVSVEVLMRWRHPEFGLIKPAEFIQVAEEANLIMQLDEWVIETACRDRCEWYKKGITDLQLRVNISTDWLNHNDLPEKLYRITEKYDIPAAGLSVEITESRLLRNLNNAIDVLKQLKRMGIKVVVDNFGTGFAFLNYLRRLPIDGIKIDRSFVEGLPTDRHDAAISTAVIKLAKSMGLKVSAQGVENKEQLDFLKNSGCDEFQGYYFCPALAEKRLLKYLLA